jgi:hypothetical protein
MTAKNEIIAALYVSDEFLQAISKMEPEHLRDDLKQEVMIILLETPEEKIIELNDSGGLKFYTVRVILNLMKSNTSPLFKKYRKPIEEFNERLAPCVVDSFIPDSEMRIQKELREDRAMEFIDTLYWYDQTLVKVYLKVGNYRAMEKELDIPWESCYSTIQKVIKKVREHVI